VIKINRFRISISSNMGDYGFETEFAQGLNIVRGNNSSGKSTLFRALTYSLGMEEIFGAKGSKNLPFAIKDFIEDHDGKKAKILSSCVYIEIQNSSAEVITVKRYIVSEEFNSKLAVIIHGAYLSDNNKSYKTTPTYLHDAGSAQHETFGYFRYLEGFLGLNLPDVALLKGKETKLYLQTLFSALFVEQKRGWTDYIANTPYYGIRDVKTKIVEFLLNLDVFENDREKTASFQKLIFFNKSGILKGLC